MKFDEARRRIDETLAKREPRVVELPNFRRAAVLVPILARPDGPTVLFTQRTDTMKDHPGQISFPGGRFEAGEDARAAALRETHEEVGLEPARVQPVAMLDDQISVSSFVVTPVVGLVAEPPASFTHQESEVLEPFEVSLERLRDPRFFRIERWKVEQMPPFAPVAEILRHRGLLDEYDTETHTYPVYFYDGGPGRNIWGLTARILKDFLDLAFA